MVKHHKIIFKVATITVKWSSRKKKKSRNKKNTTQGIKYHYNITFYSIHYKDKESKTRLGRKYLILSSREKKSNLVEVRKAFD